MAQLSTTHHRRTVAYLVLTVFLFLSPLRVVAVSIAEYQQRLKSAINDLETLVDLEDESDSDFSRRVEYASASILAGLPENEKVEFGEDVCDVDNSWLHKELNGLKELSVLEQLEKIRHVRETLQAIEQRVQERQEPGRSMDSKDQGKTKLESILARPEYATEARGQNALARVLQDFLRWLAKFFPQPQPIEPGRANWLSLFAQILVIGFALFVIAYVVRILLKRFKRSGQLRTSKKREPRIVLGERLEPEETATDLLSEAEALARRGDLRAAIRKAYIALLVELGDRKLISLAQHKTNRDYLNSIRSLPHLYPRMNGLTESFERHWYGFAEATQHDWQDFRAGYLAALHTRN